MTAVVPQIQVTDPHSKDVPASPPSIQSPAPTSLNGADLSRPQSRNSSANGESRPASSRRTTPSTIWRNKSDATSGPSEVPSSPTALSDAKLPSQAAIDPLSEHLIKRTNAQNHAANKFQSLETSQSQTPTSPTDGLVDNKSSLRTDTGITSQKDKRKRVSILSRLRGNKNKDGTEQEVENESVIGDGRPEGTNAEVFSQPIDNIEYNPRHPQPPAYIKVRMRNKKDKDFDHLFLAQELHGKDFPAKTRRGRNNSVSSTTAPIAPGSGGTIWAMEFSKDGKYLAAAGQDKIVRVWAVLSSPEDRRAHEKEEEAAHSSRVGPVQHLNAPVFQGKPIKEYQGHSSTILDLSWSKNNFLLSSSMDKTVRLWHISRSECLCTFKHNDFVPSIMFHPRDDRFFLAGSLDSKLRLWSIPDKNVAYMAQLPDMITAVAFTPDGKTAIAGCLSGLCLFYDTEGLKYQTQIHVRSAHGKNAKGSKITGIQAVNMPPTEPNGEVKLLITSNDSRIRLYNLRDKSLEIKFKGNENNCSQIRASFSDDARYVICGSEDRKAYIWPGGYIDGEKPDKRPVEMFEAHSTITTTAILAPTRTRQLLSSSEDPVYDICNPPPVQLVSREDSISSKHATETGSIQATPTPAETGFKKPEENPAYVTRSQHKDGNIIITADHAGKIKVFRQDCAFQKRRTDNWDAGSTFSRRVTTGLGRSSSIKTHGSGRSRRNSVSQQPNSSERILSWRQSIASSQSMDHPSPRRSLTKNRSISPRKSMGQVSVRSTATKSAHSPLATSATDFVPPLDSAMSASESRSGSLHTTSTNSNHRIPTIASPKEPTPTQASHLEHAKRQQLHKVSDDQRLDPSKSRQESEASSLASPSPSSENPLWLQGTQSYLFWSNWRNPAKRNKTNNETIGNARQGSEVNTPTLLEPPGAPLVKEVTAVSRLSDEESSAKGGESGQTSERDDERGRKGD
ncbi:MAG: hypothetical protein M1820_000916 [Bogoriella megaspora]|nr:MAG: hypothetical protein M1820_000916 [Bogoriella megaspora]